MKTWRETSTEFAEVGRSLGVIEQAVKDVGATGTRTDQQAICSLQAAYSAALKMVRALDMLRRIDD